MNRYQDIIHLPHHVSAKRARMSDYDRAAQFSPFAALVGYEEAIDETGRLTQQRIVLTESAKEEINAVLQQLVTGHDTTTQIQCTWFCPDQRKDGGAYLTENSFVHSVDLYRKVLLLEDREVPLEDIVALRILGKTEKI